MICPACKGDSPAKRFAFVTRKDGRTGCEEIDFVCRVCDGEGNATEGDVIRWQDGRRHREERMERRETVYACAKRLGISSAAVSSMERGHRPE